MHNQMRKSGLPMQIDAQLPSPVIAYRQSGSFWLFGCPAERKTVRA
jgi:hypothetical protein